MARKRFRALRTIGNIYKGLGGVALLVTVVAALASVVSGGALGGIGGRASMVGGLVTGGTGAVVLLVFGGLMALGLFGTGEAIFVILAIEENTRSEAELLERFGRDLGHLPAPQPQAPKGNES